MIKIKTMKTTIMKTMRTIYIIAVLLGLQFNQIHAANPSESRVLSNTGVTGSTGTMLMPATPLEATFEDFAETNFSGPDVYTLAPVNPMIADFSDEAPALEVNITNLAPVTPKEADFEEITGIELTSSFGNLAPVTPEEASFEELEHA
jgi:hypothetical protein